MSFSDMVMQKLFDTETPSGRQCKLAEIPRRLINLGYDDIELADPNPATRLRGWDSISDQSLHESSGMSNQGFSNYSGSVLTKLRAIAPLAG